MNVTPERSLELADEYDRQAERHILIATDPFADAGWQQEQAGECLEKAAILRHYAEIAPKWQAVLDAEPVALIEWSKSNVHGGVEIVAALLQPAIAGAQLIIKPTA